MTPEPNDPDRIDISSWFGILRRQKHLILGTSALVLGATAAWMLAVTPEYTARATIRIEPETSVLQDETGAAPGNPAGLSALVDGEAAILQSDSLILKLILKKDLLRDKEFGIRPSRLDAVRALMGMAPGELPSGKDALDAVCAGVRDKLHVRRIGLTNLVEIGFTSADPDQAALLSNELADLYIRSQVEGKVERALVARDIIARRIEVSRGMLAEAEARVDDFISDLGGDVLGALGKQDLVDMRTRLDALSEDARTLDGEAARLARLVDTRDFALVTDELADEASKELLRQRSRLEKRLAGAGPVADATGIRAEIERIDGELSLKTQDALKATRGRIDETRAALDRTRADLRTGVLESNLPADTFSRIYALQQEAGIARNEYQGLLTRMRQLDSLSTLQVADARVVSEALPPHAASFPDLPVSLGLGALAALILGCGLAFLREFRIGGYTSTGQLVSTLPVSDAVAIPAITSGKIAGLVTDEPLGVYAEAMRRLRFAAQALLRSGEGRKGRIICVTSARPDEGKTTLATSLARSFASSGVRTALVDLDLRNPSIAACAGTPSSDALVRFLSGNGAEFRAGDSGLRSESSTLDVIPGGSRARVPTDNLLTSQAFLAMLDGLRDRYAVVVIDTPPVLPVIDALLVARHADLVVMPVRFSHTDQPAVGEALRRIRMALPEGAQILPVLNMEKGRGTGDYDSYYGGYANA
ncbi:AAA family ATPase [Cereibacter sphaeroides]|uniref:GumC family protein n=1 Tax=Cereibacter sphaeroides TaxID=1063 RepID=UPI001F462FEF|nr:AAA family ATPase [Cereibacter sphaeroides]MCE6959233.1 AAA family ATPase [Cereibacter sphaeroides]MCE6972036.1 AAA family ATPase [Cereibacter sphaeroides]